MQGSNGLFYRVIRCVYYRYLRGNTRWNVGRRARQLRACPAEDVTGDINCALPTGRIAASRQRGNGIQFASPRWTCGAQVHIRQGDWRMGREVQNSTMRGPADRQEQRTQSTVLP